MFVKIVKIKYINDVINIDINSGHHIDTQCTCQKYDEFNSIKTNETLHFLNIISKYGSVI